MTVDQLIARLQELSADGHGKKELEYDDGYSVSDAVFPYRRNQNKNFIILV